MMSVINTPRGLYAQKFVVEPPKFRYDLSASDNFTKVNLSRYADERQVTIYRKEERAVGLERLGITKQDAAQKIPFKTNTSVLIFWRVRLASKELHPSY